MNFRHLHYIKPLKEFQFISVNAKKIEKISPICIDTANILVIKKKRHD